MGLHACASMSRYRLVGVKGPPTACKRGHLLLGTMLAYSTVAGAASPAPAQLPVLPLEHSCIALVPRAASGTHVENQRRLPGDAGARAGVAVAQVRRDLRGRWPLRQAVSSCHEEAGSP